jgi:hypothetical protein
MRQKLALICSLLALGLTPALGAGDFVDSSALHAAGLVKYWQLPLPLQPGQELGFSYLVDDQFTPPHGTDTSTRSTRRPGRSAGSSR